MPYDVGAYNYGLYDVGDSGSGVPGPSPGSGFLMTVLAQAVMQVEATPSMIVPLQPVMKLTAQQAGETVMPLLGKYIKQPAEILDYDIDFSKWFAGRGDAPSSIVVTATTGITVVSSEILGLVVRVTLSGGVNRGLYKITVRLTTNSARVKECDFTVGVEEV